MSISLEVVEILYPEYEWIEHLNSKVVGTNPSLGLIEFDYTTDDALGKMCVWYANNVNLLQERLARCLRNENKHRALAEAIMEVNK